MRRAARVTLQLHQILRLPRKMHVMIDPAHVWNVIYNLRSNRHHPHTSPNTAPATQNECHDWLCSHMKRHFQCAEQQESPSNFTKYCACHAKWISWLIRIAYETSFTMRGATVNTLQPHQILRLPRKRNDSIVPAHIWNVIYNARSNRNLPPTSPNTAPATPKECHDWSASHMKRHLQCAEQQASTSNLTKYCACHAKLQSQILEKCTENSWSGISNARPMRDRSDHDPTQKTQTATRRATEATFRTRQEQILLKITTFPAPAIIPNFTTCCACHEKWHMNFTKCCTCHKKWHMNFTKCCTCHAKGMTVLFLLTYETSFTMRGATGNTLQPHHMLHLPRIMNVMIETHHRWNVIYNAQSNRQHPPTSPNIAPATHNECHDWGTSQMKRHLQCAEQQATPSNLTKYCACHAKWPPKIRQKIAENRWNVISNARPIRAWSDHDPRPFREWSDPENANRNPPRHRGYLSHSPGADSIENYNVSRSGYHSKFHHMLRLPRKVTHELHQMLHLPQKVTHELHQMLHLPQKVKHERHQMLHLPRKVTGSDTWLLLLLLLVLYYYYYYCYDYYCYAYYYYYY